MATGVLAKAFQAHYISTWTMALHASSNGLGVSEAGKFWAFGSLF